MAENYSPLRYPGGKSRLGDFLIEVMRKNDLREPVYIEPYAGGAGAALRLLFEEYVESITINDLDPRIRCFWQAVTRHTEAFLDLLARTPLTVREWRRQRAVYLKRDLRSVLRLGFATFYLNRTSRSGIHDSGGPIGGIDQTGNYKIDARFNRKQLAQRIVRLAAYADRIDITGEDGLALLRKLQRSDSKAPRAFVYLDPPYYSKGRDLYFNNMSHQEHAALARFLQSAKRFRWVMTYDDVPAVRKLYEAMPQVGFDLSYSSYERRTGKELLIHPPEVDVSSAVPCLPCQAA